MSPPVLTPGRVRRAELASMLAGFFSVPLMLAVVLSTWWLFAPWIGSLAALLAGTLFSCWLLWLVLDLFSLGLYDRRLRRDVEHRLRDLGELTFDSRSADVYWVGLGFPGTPAPGWAETDRDVGLLHLELDRLTYRGDRFHFEATLDQIERVEILPLGNGLPQAFKKLLITFTDGAEFDAIELSGRDGSRLSTGNRAVVALGQALQQRLGRRRPGRLRGQVATSETRLAAHSVIRGESSR